MSDRRSPNALLLLLAFLQGCGAQVAMHDPRIPDPLIAKMPLHVGVRFPDVFDHYVHEERVIGKETWTIDLGESNKLLFQKLFGSMFASMTVIQEGVDPAALGVDAMIEPGIDAFEFSVPEQSQTDAFAVWIRYRIRIFDDKGTQVANWPISAYGKSQSSAFGGDDALRRAAVLAMRDAAALIILQMDKSTGISRLQKAATESPEAATDPPETGLNAGNAPAAVQTAVEDMSDESG